MKRSASLSQRPAVSPLLLAITAILSAALACGDEAPAPTTRPPGQFPVWAVSGMERVSPDDPPGSARRAILRAARGEYEPFQIIVRAPEGGLTNVNLSVSDLRCENGSVIPADRLTLYREHYVYVGESSPAEPEDANQPLGVGWYPDALIPFVDPVTGEPPGGGELRAAPFDLESGQNQPFWVDVFAPRDAPPGTCAGAFTVTSDQGEAGGEIELIVWNFELPLKPPLLSSFIFQNISPSRSANLELLRHRVMPSAVNPADEREFIDDYGLTAVDLGFFSGAIYGHCEMTPAPSIAEIQAAAARHQPDVFLYDFTADEIDECPGLFDPLKEWARNLHAAGIPNLVTITPRPELYDDGAGRSAVDIWGLLPLMHDDAPERVAEVLGIGHQVWSYNALVQDGYSPKWELDFAPINYRIFHGFINQSLGLTGVLYWAVDWWTDDPWTDPLSWEADGDYYPGEGVLVYPGEPVGIEGVVPSMRLKWIREGVEDYEYIALLRQHGRGEWALAIARSVGADWSHWTQDPAELEAARLKLGEMLSSLASSPAPPTDQATATARPTDQPTARADGAELLYSPDSPASAQNPAFAPDGRAIVFTLFHNGYNLGPAGLYRLPLDGGSTNPLTPTPVLDEPDHDAVNLPGSIWDAAAGRLTFASDRDAEGRTDEIWTMTADGDDLFRVTRHSPPVTFLEPSFSPDGQWIVFESKGESTTRPLFAEGEQGSIWKVRADGTQLTQLTDGFDDRQPNWSPVGDRILFQRRAPSADDWNIYTMTPEGSDLRQITTSPAEDTDASWSPDGRWIVYSSDHGRRSPSGGGLPAPNLFIVSAYGGQPIRLTHDETRGDGAASWSPDGEWIAFESYASSGGESPASLWRISAKGRPRLAAVSRWLYLLDVNLDSETVDRIAASGYDMVVLDFIPSEANNADYPMGEVVAQLQDAPHPKLVIAYVDIGQAEDYRAYWQPGWQIGDPDWIVGGDPDGWTGNYPVAFWRDEWREIWLGPRGQLQAILDAGFDGIYLDWVEAYSDENVIAAAERDGVDPTEEMIGWVRGLADYGRARRPGFIVIAQNAAELTERDDYLAIVDAVSQEQIWFDGAADNDPPGDCSLPRTEDEVDSESYAASLSPGCREMYDQFPDSTLHVSSESYLRYLTLAREKGTLVFTVDYALDPENVAWVYQTSRSLRFVPLVSNRGLDMYVSSVP